MAHKGIENLEKRTPFRKGDAAPRLAQAKGAAKRREKRTLKEILLAEIAKDGKKARGILAVLERYEKGDLQAFDRVRDLLNEKDDELLAQRNSLNLVVDGDTADLLKKIVNG